MSEEINDLSKLAQKRTRDAVKLVIQLVDDPEDRTIILLAVVLDVLRGAAQSISEGDDGLTEDQCLAKALMMVMRAFGAGPVIEAFKQMRKDTA